MFSLVAVNHLIGYICIEGVFTHNVDK